MPKTRTAPPANNSLMLKVEEAAQLLGIGRSACYEAVRRHELPTVRIGRRILVSRAGLMRMINGEAPAGQTGADTTDDPGGTSGIFYPVRRPGGNK